MARSKPFSATIDANVHAFSEKWTSVRLIGPMRSVYEFWIPIETRCGKQTSIRKFCIDWDGEAHCMTADVCPYRKAGLAGRPVYYSNAISRKLQKPNAIRAGHETFGSSVRVLRIPPRLHGMLQNLAALNYRIKKSGSRKTYDLAHPRYGLDVQIKISPTTPYSYYNLRPIKQTRLTADELEYRLCSLVTTPETLAEALHAWNKLKFIRVDA